MCLIFTPNTPHFDLFFDFSMLYLVTLTYVMLVLLCGGYPSPGIPQLRGYLSLGKSLDRNTAKYQTWCTHTLGTQTRGTRTRGYPDQGYPDQGYPKLL